MVDDSSTTTTAEMHPSARRRIMSSNHHSVTIPDRLPPVRRYSKLAKSIAYRPGQVAVYHPMLERKLILKPFQVHPPELPADFVADSWENSLRGAVRASYGCDGGVEKMQGSKS
ncbi:Cullin-4A, partial [Perkinsus olseni]